MSDNEIYLLIKYIKSVLWRVAKCLSYIEEARCLKVKPFLELTFGRSENHLLRTEMSAEDLDCIAPSFFIYT